jgi:tetratricopeptide (TPR) repeat protein
LPLFEKLQDQIGMGYYYRGLGDIAIMLGSWEEARKQYEEALAYQEKVQRVNRTWGMIYHHAKLGIVFVHLGIFNLARQHLKASLS